MMQAGSPVLAPQIGQQEGGKTHRDGRFPATLTVRF